MCEGVSLHVFPIKRFEKYGNHYHYTYLALVCKPHIRQWKPTKTKKKPYFIHVEKMWWLFCATGWIMLSLNRPTHTDHCMYSIFFLLFFPFRVYLTVLVHIVLCIICFLLLLFSLFMHLYSLFCRNGLFLPIKYHHLKFTNQTLRKLAKNFPSLYRSKTFTDELKYI